MHWFRSDTVSCAEAQDPSLGHRDDRCCGVIALVSESGSGGGLPAGGWPQAALKRACYNGDPIVVLARCPMERRPGIRLSKIASITNELRGRQLLREERESSLL